MRQPANKLKILYYGSTLSIQKGANRSMYRLVKVFNNDQTEAVAVLPGHDGIAQLYREAGLRYEVIPSVPAKFKRSLKYQLTYAWSVFREINQLREVIRRERVDIVHVNDITFFPALLAARMEGVKAVCHVRFISIRSRLVKKALVYLTTTFADAVVCVSKAVQTHLFEGKTKWRNASIYVVYNPSPDSVDFSINGHERDLRDELSIPRTSFLGCKVSKFTRNKGQMVLVKAAAHLKTKGFTEKDFVFLLVGGPLENHMDYYESVQNYVKAHQLEGMVRFLGVRKDVANLFSSSDVAIHVPIHEDPFPGVVLEAMLCGKAVIGSKSGGVPEIIDDGQNGILIPKDDPEALADKLIYLKSHPQVLQQLQEAAPEAIRRKFSFEEFKTKHFKIYHSLKPELKPQEETYEVA